MVVSACGASTEPPATAPETGRGSVGPSDTTGRGDALAPPPGALYPSWGPAGTEPSPGAPSSSSTMMWGTAWLPPGAWDPSGLRPLWDLDPPADRGDHVVLLRQLVEPVRIVSPTLYLRDQSLGRVGRWDPRLLGLTVILGRDLAALRFPRSLRLLILFNPFLLLIPGPILGPDRLVLRDRVRESLTIPILYK